MNYHITLLYAGILILSGCSSSTIKNYPIVGVWENLTSDMSIEFGQDGLYYMLKADNERIILENGESIHYTYMPKTDMPNNFILKDPSSGILYKGNLSFLNPDKIQLTLCSSLDQECAPYIYAEYHRKRRKSY